MPSQQANPSQSCTPDNVSIELVADPRTLREVGRLRYTVFREEQGKSHPDCDDRQRLFLDGADERARVLAARIGDSLIGTSRHRAVNPQELDSLVRNPELRLLLAPLRQRGELAHTDRLMVRREYRTRHLAWQLARRHYQLGLAEGIRADLIQVETHLRPLYFKLGYVDLGTPFDPHGNGLRQTMLLVLRDREHLSRTGSPFVRDLDGRPHDVQLVARLREALQSNSTEAVS